MARLFFGLLLLAGLGAVGFGGLQLFAPHMLASVPGISVEVPEADAASAASAPSVAPVEPVIAAAPPPPPPAPQAPELDNPVFGAASAPIVRSPVTPAPPLEESLREVPVAYETPKTASYGKPFEVTFALDARAGAQTATGGLPGVGEIVEGQARVSERVKASLVGTAFEIELQSPEVQLLGADTENRWLWLVTPKAEGDQPLYVELFALVGEDAKPVRTFNGTVTVEVTQFQRVVSLATAANPLAVFLGGIGSTIGGLFGFFRFLRRRG